MSIQYHEPITVTWNILQPRIDSTKKPQQTNKTTNKQKEDYYHYSSPKF